MTTIHKDATKGWYLPQSSAEWALLVAGTGIAVPDALYIFGNTASGNQSDAIGAFTLTKNGTVTYQQSVSGWSDLAAVLTDNTSGYFQSTSTSLPNVNTNSALLILVGKIASAPGTARCILELGTTTQSRIDIANSNTKFTLLDGANTFNGTVTNTNLDRIWFLQHDKTNSAARGGTDAEVSSTTFSASVTGKEIEFGGQARNPPGIAMILGAAWFNGNAELSTTSLNVLFGLIKNGPWSAPFTVAGDSTASFTGAELDTGVFTIAGDSTATFTGAELDTGIFTIAGDSTATFTGAELFTAPFTIAGDSTATFTGAELFTAPFTAAGDSTASFTGAELDTGIFTIAGDSTATFTGAELDTGVFTITGDSVLNFVGEFRLNLFCTIIADSSLLFTGSELYLNDPLEFVNVSPDVPITPTPPTYVLDGGVEVEEDGSTVSVP